MPEIKKYLNRDGLEEYNSLLPHSSAEMQTYVNEWMDEHPEASTTVQDGAITERKLADKSVSLRTLADDTVHMLKGAILTGNLSGNVLTADDAYSAPPVSLTVDGKSTQDGTPTPDAPVEIVSLEQVGLTFAGKNLLDVSDWEHDSNSGIVVVEDGTALRISQQPYQEQRNRYYLPASATYVLTFDYETIDLTNANANFYVLTRKEDGTDAGSTGHALLIAAGYKGSVSVSIPSVARYIDRKSVV